LIATIGLVQAVFQARGIDPRTREMIILRAANFPGRASYSDGNWV
jgi:hypothetical protein